MQSFVGKFDRENVITFICRKYKIQRLEKYPGPRNYTSSSRRNNRRQQEKTYTTQTL